MTKKPSPLPALLKHLAKATERLSDDEIADVIEGRRRLILSTEEAGPSRPAGATDEPPDFESLIASLKATETRDTAHRLIEDAALTRSQLNQLARALDLPVQRSDDIARLREKIVETTIGFRLTALAIHRNG
jgi:hypothetical protein